MKKIVSLFTIALLAVASLCGTLASVGAVSIVDYSSKIDSALLEVMDNAMDKERLSVSVWFYGVEESIVEDEIFQEVHEEIDDNKIDIDVLDICSLDKSDYKGAEQDNTNVDISVSQDLLAIRRSISSELNKEYNETCVEKVITTCGISKSNITYVSKYLPNAEMTLTKDEVETVAKNKNVESLYLVDEITCDLSNENVEVNEISALSVTDNNYNKALYDYIGISEIKEYYNGEDIVIGNIDWGLPDTSLDCFKSALADCRLHPVGKIKTISSHSTLTTSQIIGSFGSYEGIATDCTMYCIATGDPNEQVITWKDKIETLIGCGVNIINSSFETYGDGRNNYGESAKWIDAMINTEKVLFVQSAANDTPSKDRIISGGMAYNSIVVGAYDIDNNKVFDYSAYNSGEGEYKQYKPDLVAPCSMIVQYSSNVLYTCGGTSCSAPVVSGALALFFQGKQNLLNYPTLVKSFLLNGTTYLGESNIKNSDDEFVAFNRVSGAGVLNVNKSSTNYSTRNWDYRTTSETTKNEKFDFYVTTKLRQVRVTLCADKENTFDCTDGVVNAEVPVYKLTVSHGTDTWISICTVDNKCSVVFTPTAKGTYSVKVTPLSNCCIGGKFALVYTSI